MSASALKEELKKIVDEAQKRLDLETAQNPALQKAIQIVEIFLRKTRRVCYGGQAINAQLPEKDKFYDPDTSLPDYDFFSPNAAQDIKDLILDLQAAGYTEISKRIGIHEGTTKIYVNYAAIADITQLIPEFYDSIYKESVVVKGIHYTDTLFLKMLMYLELSRPRGQVDRWIKVYERLQKLEAAFPLKRCSNRIPALFEDEYSARARAHLVKYMIAHRRAFMGGDVQALYKQSGHGRSAVSRTRFLLEGSAPVIFLSPDAELDGDRLATDLRARKVSIEGYQNMLPALVALYRENHLVGLIVQEEACHSIITLPLTKQRVLRVASIDTLLTFFIGFYYREPSLVMTKEALLCWIREMIELSKRYHEKPNERFPAFSLECSGYQTTFASLLKAKAARIEADRQRLSSGVRVTRKSKSKIRQRTMKTREH